MVQGGAISPTKFVYYLQAAYEQDPFLNQKMQNTRRIRQLAVEKGQVDEMWKLTGDMLMAYVDDLIIPFRNVKAL